MKLLDIVHPAARTLVDIAKSQDAEVGDGTTTVVMLAGEFLRQAKSFIEEGVHAQVIIRAYRQATALAIAHIKTSAVQIEKNDKGIYFFVFHFCIKIINALRCEYIIIYT